MGDSAVNLIAVQRRMTVLEQKLAQQPGDPDEVPIYVVMARLLEIPADTPGLEKCLLGEMRRVRTLVEDYYSKVLPGRNADALYSAIGFLQGVTFARALDEERPT